MRVELPSVNTSYVRRLGRNGYGCQIRHRKLARVDRSPISSMRFYEDLSLPTRFCSQRRAERAGPCDATASVDRRLDLLSEFSMIRSRVWVNARSHFGHV